MMNKDVEKQKKIAELLLKNVVKDKAIIEVVKGCIDLAYLDGKKDGLEFGEKTVEDFGRKNMELISVFYNASEDGLPKKMVEKSDWD